jgi:hypothetical protein
VVRHSGEIPIWPDSAHHLIIVALQRAGDIAQLQQCVLFGSMGNLLNQQWFWQFSEHGVCFDHSMQNALQLV